MLKVNKKDTRTHICSSFSIVNFEQAGKRRLFRSSSTSNGININIINVIIINIIKLLLLLLSSLLLLLSLLLLPFLVRGNYSARRESFW